PGSRIVAPHDAEALAVTLEQRIDRRLGLCAVRTFEVAEHDHGDFGSLSAAARAPVERNAVALDVGIGNRSRRDLFQRLLFFAASDSGKREEREHESLHDRLLCGYRAVSAIPRPAREEECAAGNVIVCRL